MRIGHDDHYLSIEVTQLEGGFSAFCVEAVACGNGRKFSAFHGSLLVDSSEATKMNFGDFAEFRSNSVNILLTEGGWFRLERDWRGYVTIHYRISGWKPTASLEGEVIVEGELAGNFCCEFGALLKIA